MLNTTTALDIIAFVFCSGSAFFIYKTQRLTKNKYFWPIAAALIYASCLRFLILLVDFKISLFGLTKANCQVMFSGFYILSFIGFAGIYYGLKKFFKKPKKTE